ncbi:MAG: acyl carrier protein [Deltaproteobacteria bacterium]|nr:acyl carrier protein [Deltaproteobacteria bacterium]
MAEPLKNTGRDLQGEVISAIAAVTGYDESDVKPDMLFIEDLGCQSLQIMEIVLELQSVFDIEIPDGDIDALRSVDDAVGYVKRRLRE